MFLMQLLILQVVLFAALAVVLRRLLGRHATTATTHLQGLSQEYLKKHEELKKHLEEGERHYQEQLAKAQEETQQLKIQASKEAEAARQHAIEQAHQEAERIIQQAMQARAALQQELTRASDAKAVEQAGGLLERALPKEFRELVHAHWVDGLIKNGLISLERIQSREAIREARAVSAFPLTPAQRKVLLERLQTALGSGVTLQESVDPRLIAGLIVTVGHLVLDGSLASKLLEAARHAQESAE